MTNQGECELLKTATPKTALADSTKPSFKFDLYTKKHKNTLN